MGVSRMTDVEKEVLQVLIPNKVELLYVRKFKNKVVFVIKGITEELNERITKENPTEDFINELRKMVVKK